MSDDHHHHHHHHHHHKHDNNDQDHNEKHHHKHHKDATESNETDHHGIKRKEIDSSSSNIHDNQDSTTLHSPMNKKAHINADAKSIEKAHSFLESAKIKDVLREEAKKRLVTLEHNMTVAEAINELAKQKILSAPVILSASLEDDDFGSYLGILDLDAVLHKFIQGFEDSIEAKKKQESETSDEKANEKEEFDSIQFTQICSDILQKKLITICGEEDVSLVFKAYDDTSVHSLITSAFLHPQHANKPVHRVAIFDPAGRIQRIISQSDIIHFIKEHLDEFGQVAHQTIKQLDLGSESVVSVKEGTTAAQAYRTMTRQIVSSVGVVDSHHKLVDVLSASDLRGLRDAHIENLLKPIHEFKQVSKQGVVTCHLHDTLKHILDLVTTHRLHRIYVVDEHHLPIRVISLTDILNLISRL